LNGITNQKQLEAMLNGLLKDIVSEIAEEATEKLKTIVREDWYRSSPAKRSIPGYDRTGQFINAITHTAIKPTGNGFEVMVWFDDSQITSTKRDQGTWAYGHNVSGQDTWNGEDIGKAMVRWIEEGTPSSLYSYGGIGMVKKTAEWLERELPGIAESVLKRHGLQAKISRI